MNKLFKYFAVLLLFYSASMNNTHCQGTGILRGFLSDSLSGEALPYGNILIKELNLGTSTDEKGYYLFPSVESPATFTIVVSYVGYQTKEIEAAIATNASTLLNINLAPVSFELQTIEKIAKRYDDKNKPDLGVHKVTINELETIPQGVETDIMRSIQHIPGVTIVSDVSAKYYVRGGTNNQNLILLNDVTVYNPFHALGMFSIVDPEMINSFEFYKGGFPLEYAGRSSSVLDLVTKEGNKNRVSAKTAFSLLSAKGSIEGPIPSGSFIITGRKSISNEVLKDFYNDRNLPVSFYDFSAKINYSNQSFWKDAKFILHAFVSDDRISNNNSLRADYNWRNSIYGLTYFQVSDSPLIYEISFSLSNFDGIVDPKLSNIKPVKNVVRDFQIKADFNYVYSSKDEISFGLKINEIKTELFLQNSFGLIQNIGPDGSPTNWSIYVKYQLLRFENLGVEMGSRLNFIDLSKGGENGFPIEPRFNLVYNLSELIKLQTSIGVFNQELTTLSDEDEVISIFEPWIVLPDNIKKTKSVHYTGGIDFTISDQMNIRTAGYYKRTLNLPLLNKQKIFPTDVDLISGESESFGGEFYSRFSSRGINLVGSYSLSWVYNKVGDIKYSPRYDNRHTASLLIELNLGKGWTFSTQFNYKSGFPFTKLIGYYDKYYFDDGPGELSLFNSYRNFSLLGDRNLGRTTDYHRLDLNILKKINLSFIKLFVGVSILNVYDRENLFYFDLETGERVNMLPFLPSFSIKAEI